MTEEPPNGRWAGLWRRLVGDLDAVGWSVLPMFLVVGLAGAVMAGALAVVYYSQQVADLEAQTRDARANLEQAVTDVDRAGDEALDLIASEVEAVRDVLARDVGIEDVETLGLVVIEALVNSPAPPSATVTEGQEPPPPEPPPPSETGTDAPPGGAREGIDQRFGVGFAVAADGGEMFFATSYGLVFDEQSRAGVVEEVIVHTFDGQTFAGTVHSWDEERGISLVRAATSGLPIPRWRSSQTPLEAGDGLTVVGLTPERSPVQIDASAGFVSVEAIVTSLSRLEFLRGAPVVDRAGHIVAIYTPSYRPFGAGAGDSYAMAPVGLLCERMLNGCLELEADPEATETDTDATPASEAPSG